MNDDRKDLESRFEGLYRLYFHRVVGFLVNMGFSPDRAEELAQETFRRVFVGMRQREVNLFESYLFRTAQRVGLNEIRAGQAQMRNRPEVSLDDESRPADRAAGRSLPPDEAFADREERERQRRLLYEAIRELPDSHRRCLLLWLGDLKYREIAKILGVTLDAVKSRLHETRKRLEVYVQEKLECEKAGAAGGGPR